MSCYICGKTHQDKPCPPGYVVTTTTEDPILCPPDPVCEDIYGTHCVYYSGPDLECAGIYNGDLVSQVIQNLLNQLAGCCIPTTTTTTSTTTTTTTTTTTSTTTTTTTTTQCPNDYYLICCGTYAGGGVDPTPVIIKPCSVPSQFTFATYQVYNDTTDGTGANSYNWVVCTLSDIQTLGWNDVTSTYLPDWNQFTLENIGQSTFAETLFKCANSNDGVCPPPDLIPTTTTTSTTTILECICYELFTDEGNLVYYKTCDGTDTAVPFAGTPSTIPPYVGIPSMLICASTEPTLSQAYFIRNYGDCVVGSYCNPIPTTSTTTTTTLDLCKCYKLYNPTDNPLSYTFGDCEKFTTEPSSVQPLETVFRCSLISGFSADPLLEVDDTLGECGAVSCVNPIAYCTEITAIGTVILSYIGYDALTVFTTLINDTIIVCAWDNSVTKLGGSGTLISVPSTTVCTSDFDCTSRKLCLGYTPVDAQLSCVDFGSCLDYYVSVECYTNLIVGCAIYSDIQLTTYVPDGYYSNGTTIYHVVSGIIVGIDICVPPYTTTTTTTTLPPITTTTTVIPTTTTTTTVIPTTTTTTIQNFAKCIDCAPSLTSVTDNGVGLLSVGNMASLACTLGDYVIDWYLDSTSNPIEFTSGNTGNTDPAIQQFHPFTGAAARPSKGGSWIPVIRYAYLDGIKYTSTITPGASYASDLATCLSPITVLNLNCSNGTNTTVGFEQYSHRFAYLNGVQTASDASKSLVFTLNSDGSTKYFAWYFSGVTVSDRIQFTYVSPTNSTSTPLQDFAVGTDLPATDFTGSTKKVKLSAYKYLIDLTGFTYALGDYILIDITSNYYTATSNTNWTAYFKCLTTFDPTWTRAVFDPCSPTMVYNSGLCRYELTYGFTTFDDNKNTDIWRYLTFGETVISAPGPSNSLPVVTAYFSNGLQSCSDKQFYYNPSCALMAGSYTFTRVGPNITFTFTNTTDYNKYQTDYNNAIASITPVGPTPATSDINYYRFIRMFLQKSNNDSCPGDTYTVNTNITFHYLTPVTFNPTAKTMSFTVPFVDGTPFFSTVGACAGTCTSLLYLTANNTLATSVTSQTYTASTTQVYSSNAIYYERTAPITDFSNTARYVSYYTPYAPTYPIPLADGWYNSTVSALVKQNLYYDYRDLVTITDMSDGVNNFKIESYLDVNGQYAVANKHTIYEIVNGVVTVGGCP